MTDVVELAAVHAAIDGAVVGREREVAVILAALDADRHLVLEGPPGTGKSTLLRAIARALGVGFVFVEGNAELTPGRLIGHFDPSRVLAEGYDPDVFVPGPLVTALTDGSLLYIEELNRVPEETLNVLITVMSERELHVPRYGRVRAADGFRLVAAMNPFDVVGTGRISAAMYDRLCRVRLDYQSAPEEAAIVAAEHAGRGELDVDWVGRVVEVVRRTRDHPDLAVGSSVRGAIDTAAVATSLARLRGVPTAAAGPDAALVALSGRVRVRDGSARTAEEIVAEVWRSVFADADDDGTRDRVDPAGGSAGKAPAPAGTAAG